MWKRIKKQEREIKKIFSNTGIKNHVKKLFLKKYGLNNEKKFEKIFLKKKHLKFLNTVVKKESIYINSKQKINENITFLIKNKSYRGVRHKKKLPTRGQRTHTNAKTIKKKTKKKYKKIL